MTAAMRRRLEALEEHRQPAAGYVVYVTAEEQADPAVAETAIAEHRHRTGWTGPVILAPSEVTLEAWITENGPSKIDV